MKLLTILLGLSFSCFAFAEKAVGTQTYQCIDYGCKVFCENHDDVSELKAEGVYSVEVRFYSGGQTEYFLRWRDYPSQTFITMQSCNVEGIKKIPFLTARYRGIPALVSYSGSIPIY